MSESEVGHTYGEVPETLIGSANEIEQNGKAMKQPWDADIHFDWDEESAWLIEMASRIRGLL